jgi:O-antigen biosynthesis protein
LKIHVPGAPEGADPLDRVVVAQRVSEGSSAPPASMIGATTVSRERPRAAGKFLYLGTEKFFVRGAAYGAFPPNSRGDQFPEPADVERDFAMMRSAGMNTILTYTVPPASLLDQAHRHGIRAITTIPWMEYVCFLEDRAVRADIRRQVREAVASHRGHPGMMLYCIGKEIPPSIVRWYGKTKTEQFLRDLYNVAKDEDPDCLVTYTNFPTTEYLDLSFVDVFTFNVYLHRRAEFCRYLAHLQHLAGELPFVLTEFGMCSLRHGRDRQAEFLRWQLEEIFDHGLAGGVWFGWTDPFFQDGTLVTEWGFGLVDAERRPKPAYEAARRRFSMGVPFPSDRRRPRISVVVAAHNAGSTLGGCLESLGQLRYPDYEVIVVNDGSTDDTPRIAARYPVRAITTPARGVSAARNEGLHAATGEIIAYIDSDARADPDWLSYLAAAYAESDVSGIGGPNPVPREDNWIAKCVYRSPGGPTQVMLDDRNAEHIPGCNMSFTREALEEIGGFDPIFTKAGDDVDVCWRLLGRGHRIGFQPSAVVWHHRRASVRGYWRQQVGYGESEALLERRHPSKFNPWGHAHWAGRIYAPYPFFRPLARPRIYHGLWGSAGFQPMYDPGEQTLLTFLPRAMEWHVSLLALAVLGLAFPWAFVLVGAGVVYTVWYAIATAAAAKLDDPDESRLPSRPAPRVVRLAMIACFHLLEPLARDWGRLKGQLTPWRGTKRETAKTARPGRRLQDVQPFRRGMQAVYPGGIGLEAYAFLERLHHRLTFRGCAVGWNPHSQAWDVRVRRGVLGEAYLKLVVEHHGGPRRLARMSAFIRPAAAVYWAQAVTAAAMIALAALGRLPAASLLAVLFIALWIGPVAEANRLEAAIGAAAGEVNRELNSAGSIPQPEAGGP